MASTFRQVDRTGSLANGAAVRLKLETIGTIGHRDEGDYDRAALGQFLTQLPILPRPVIARLITYMIEHLDLLDGDPDDEESDLDWEHDGREPNIVVRRFAEP
jgi:hypothetical protein